MSARSNKLAEWKMEEWSAAGEAISENEKLAIALQNRLIDMFDWLGFTESDIDCCGSSGREAYNPSGEVSTQADQDFTLFWDGEDFVLEIVQYFSTDSRFLGRTYVPVDSLEEITGELLAEVAFDLSCDNDFRITRESLKVRRMREKRMNK